MHCEPWVSKGGRQSERKSLAFWSTAASTGAYSGSFFIRVSICVRNFSLRLSSCTHQRRGLGLSLQIWKRARHGDVLIGKDWSNEWPFQNSAHPCTSGSPAGGPVWTPHLLPSLLPRLLEPPLQSTGKYRTRINIKRYQLLSYCFWNITALSLSLKLLLWAVCFREGHLPPSNRLLSSSSHVNGLQILFHYIHKCPLWPSFRTYFLRAAALTKLSFLFIPPKPLSQITLVVLQLFSHSVDPKNYNGCSRKAIFYCFTQI